MKIVRPPRMFQYGTQAVEFKKYTLEEMNAGGPSIKFTLDLSKVIYMDSGTFRIVFDLMPRFVTIIPPTEKKVIERYNDWVEGKKGLSKGIKK